MNKIEYIIGIDPGENTGFALYNNKCKSFDIVKTMTFWETIGKIKYYAEICNEWNFRESTYYKSLLVLIEDPGINKPIFYSKYGNKKFREYTRISQNVGMNKEQAKLLIEYCKRNNIPYEAIKPDTKKMTSKEIKHFTGYEGKTSQHSRDAIKLIHNYLLIKGRIIKDD